MTPSDRLAEALFKALLSADPLEVELLGIQLKKFKDIFSRTYTDVCKQSFACKLLETIENAVAAERTGSGQATCGSA